MKLTILGSGTFVHQLNRNNPSYLLENKEKKILFDFGRGCINQLLKLDKNLHEIDAIFISHMHADHSSELASFFLFILDSPNKSEIKKEYFIYGPSGIEKDLNNILKAFHLNKKKNVNRIIINELSNGN